MNVVFEETAGILLRLPEWVCGVLLGVQAFWKLHMLSVRSYRADVCVHFWDVPRGVLAPQHVTGTELSKKAPKITLSTEQLKTKPRQKINKLEPHMKPRRQSCNVYSILMGHIWKSTEVAGWILNTHSWDIKKHKHTIPHSIHGSCVPQRPKIWISGARQSP